MPADTLKTSRASQPAAAPGSPSPLAPSDGVSNNVVRMTMDEWKRTHRDFKGTHIGPDGKRWRSVLRPGGMAAVVIVK